MRKGILAGIGSPGLKRCLYLLMVLAIALSASFAIDCWRGEQAKAGSLTADITITVTPQVIGIAMKAGNGTYDFGAQDVNTTPSSGTSELCVDNTSNIVTDVTIKVTSSTWEGGDYDWTHSDTCTPGDQIVGLKANKGGTWGVGDVIVKASATFNIIADDQAANTDWELGVKMWVPTAFNGSDTGTEKSNTVRLTAAPAS